MPNNPKPPPTIDSFVRKTKPRVVTDARPSHTVTAVPRAVVRSAAADSAHIPSTSSHDEVLPSFPRGGRLRSVERPTRGHISERGETPVSLPSTPKPRKRFRKKVNGLFGDQTELKKRMSKLLVETNTRKLLSAHRDQAALALNARATQTQTEISILPSTDDVVKHLQVREPSIKDKLERGQEVKQSHDDKGNAAEISAMEDDNMSLDSFDSPAFIATAKRALGSPEKLRALRKTMGRLSPRSNERFLEEMKLGSSTSNLDQKGSKRAGDDGVEITPPDLPSVDSSEFESEQQEAFREKLLSLSPVSVERTGAPAVLRRKVRRLDRGYRSADVLRARLQGMPLSDFAASPTSHRKPERTSKWPKVKVRALDLSQEPENARYREGLVRKRTIADRLRREESQDPADEIDSDSDSSEETPPKKIKVDAGPSAQSREEESAEIAGNAFAMLVEAAAVQQKQSSASRSDETSRQPTDVQERRRKVSSPRE